MQAICTWVFGGLALLLLAGCEQRTHTIRYEVSGTARTIAVSYVNRTGATEQRDVAGSWSTQHSSTTWSHVAVTAFNPTDKGTVSCKLYVDGKLIQQATSAGGFKWAHCGTLAGIGATPTL